MHGRGSRGSRGRRGGRRGRHRRHIRLLEPVLLMKLNQGPAHGYSLMEDIDSYGLGDVQPSALYRSLRNMEEDGWITSQWDQEETQGPPRRIYSISPIGKDILKNWAHELEDSRDHISRLLDALRKGD